MRYFKENLVPKEKMTCTKMTWAKYLILNELYLQSVQLYILSRLLYINQRTIISMGPLIFHIFSDLRLLESISRTISTG